MLANANNICSKGPSVRPDLILSKVRSVRGSMKTSPGHPKSVKQRVHISLLLGMMTPFGEGLQKGAAVVVFELLTMYASDIFGTAGSFSGVGLSLAQIKHQIAELHRKLDDLLSACLLYTSPSPRDS